nr:dipeptide/oligopeptide/nickel ABC transporter ATP-binding protein [uncultured Cetobacterium sp.]
MHKPILDIKNICKSFNGKIVLNNVSFSVYPGETLGIVGKSGEGKSTIGKLLLMLLTPDSGSIIYNNSDITKLNYKEQLTIRKDIQMVLQDPYSSFNPLKKIGWHLEEALRVLNGTIKKEYIIDMMRLVGLSPEYYNKYPNELSGGQRQRILLLTSLLLNPKILVLDESISALDLSVQAQILNLLKDLQKKLNITYIFISHNQTVVEYFCDRVLYLKNGNFS